MTTKERASVASRKTAEVPIVAEVPRSGYGEEILQTLSAKLSFEFGRTKRSSRHCLENLSWSHLAG